MKRSYHQPERGIKSWHEAERPREKLRQRGAATLELVELLGILIQSGTAEATAIEIGREILRAVDYNLQLLAEWSTDDFQRFRGIGPARAAILAAALELTRRREQQRFDPRQSLTNSQETYQFLRGILGDLNHEEFWILCLNQGHRMIAAHPISKGGITGTVADGRIIFRHAINTPKCTSLILAHNHPSGQLRPSQADVQLTKKLQVAAKSLDLTILDHLIIGPNGYFSFMDERLL